MYNVLNKPSWFVGSHGVPQPNVPFYWVTENTRIFMRKGYLSDKQTTEERAVEIAEAYHSYMLKMGYPEDMANYNASVLLVCSEQGNVSFATPVWVSFGNNKGLSISCFGTDVGNDTMEDILYAGAEIGMLTKFGGGTSVNLNKIRSRGASIRTGGRADGPAHFSGLYNSMMQIARQGEARRGYCAAYVEGDHPDVMEFLDIGRDNSEIQNITTGISLTDNFLEKAFQGEEHEQDVLAKIGKTRSEIGYPYVMFKDNANKAKPKVYKDLGMDLEMSNLCSEIMLPNDIDESFVCVLSSLNLVNYDSWKNTDLVKVMISFLDVIVEESLDKIKHLYSKREREYNGKLEDNVGKLFLSRIERFLSRHRALGLGTLGLHHLYQSKMIAFESTEAAKLNYEIFSYITEETHKSTTELATLLGEPEILKGYGTRNTTTMAIAPTKSSAAILGNVSESIQPELSNYYLAALAKDTVIIKNPYLVALLESIDRNTPETWAIIEQTDSVQLLDFLTDNEKAVFKTFAEVPVRSILDQAGIRQSAMNKYGEGQGQSLNLIFHPDVKAEVITGWTFYAWKMGIKALYYQKGISPAQLNNLKILSDSRECVACSA